MGEIPMPVVEALLIRPNLRNTFRVAAKHGGLIRKERKSSWVKLKAFPSNVEQPNYT